MKISVIAAVSENQVIGKDQAIPWKQKADIKLFSQITDGHHLIMGIKTFLSIGRPLPNRTNWVLTRNLDIGIPGAITRQRLEDALADAYEKGATKVFIIGGRVPFRLGLAIADTFYLTKIHTEVEGGVQFPDVDWSRWKPVKEERYPADEQNEFPYSFCIYEKV